MQRCEDFGDDKLSCKIGDPVYEVCELNVYNGNGEYLGKTREIQKWEFDPEMHEIIAEKLGDTWFLTESEAQIKFRKLYGCDAPLFVPKKISGKEEV